MYIDGQFNDLDLGKLIVQSKSPVMKKLPLSKKKKL